MLTPRNRRIPTKARVRAWWNDFVCVWQRVGVVHHALETAGSEEGRWRVMWQFNDRGRHATHPWRGDKSHPDTRLRR